MKNALWGDSLEMITNYVKKDQLMTSAFRYAMQQRYSLECILEGHQTGRVENVVQWYQIKHAMLTGKNVNKMTM